MPICLVHHTRDIVPSALLEKIGPVIAESVAKALDVPSNPELHLSSTDVEVRFSESGPYDVCHKDVGIMIFANGGPDRENNLDKRIAMIRESLTKFVWDNSPEQKLDLSFYVYVMLQNADYVEFKPGNMIWPGL